MSPGGGLDKLPYGCSLPQWLAQFIRNLNQIWVSVERIEARPENARIGRRNSMEIMNSTGVMTYRAKRKDVSVISFSLDHCLQVAGDGTVLANTLLPLDTAALVALQAVPAIGTVVAPTINTPILMLQAILHMVQFYNYEFGIQPGDTVPIRSHKVEIGSRWSFEMKSIASDAFVRTESLS